jgi:hypothetical protein
MDNITFNTLLAKGKQYGLPVDIWYPIAMHESGGNTAAIGDSGSSFGLFQIHAPAHPLFDVTRYKDPSYQADTIFPDLKAHYDEGLSKGLTGSDLAVYVERYGERPKWNDSIGSSITGYYNQFMREIGDTIITDDRVILGDDSVPSFKAPGNPNNPNSTLDPGQWEVPHIADMPDKIMDFTSGILYKVAFFLPALILGALGFYLLFTGTGKSVVKDVIDKVKE